VIIFDNGGGGMALVKFGAQADEELLKKVRDLADKENTKLYSLINEAFKDLIEKRKKVRPRKAIMEKFAESLEEYDSLYKKLAR
jgi:hypothetical protein